MAEAMVKRGASPALLSQSFGIPVTTLMDWSQRYRKEGADALRGSSPGREPVKRIAAVGKENEARRQAVVRAKREHPEQGTRRIRDVLARFEGLGVSETTVRKVLHEEGLLEARAEPVAKPRPEEPRFERAEPNQLWQSDIFTFLLRRHERLYVTAFLDDYSRYLVSLVVAHHQKSSLVMEALQRGIADYGAPREIMTDQGRQYTAWRGHTDFEEELRRQGIRHIKSRPHHPQTMGKIERFWKTLWDEFLSRTVFADFADAERRIALFVKAYNFRRPHQGIGGVVPADRFFRAAPQVRQAVEGQVAANAMALAHERPKRPPFYLVGRLGDQDLSIALSGRGLLVRLGETEQVIALGKEDEDEQTSASRRITEAPSASRAEVAFEGIGSGSGRTGEMPSRPERPFRGEAGDGRGRGSEDFTGDVLPAGDESAERDAAGPGAGVVIGVGSGESQAEDHRSGSQGEGADAGTSENGAALADDAAGHEGRGGENRLDPQWEQSLSELEEEEQR
jgi:transposase InsO family protein